MSYPTNHPFSQSYVSQIPVTESDRKSAAAKGYIRRMQEEGKVNASKQSFPPIAPLSAVYSGRGHCPLCNGEITHKTRKHRRIDGRASYVCAVCAGNLSSRRKS